MWGNPKRIIGLRNKILVVQICVAMLKKQFPKYMLGEYSFCFWPSTKDTIFLIKRCWRSKVRFS